MKQASLSAVAIVFLVGLSCALGIAWGQNSTGAPAIPHKVGLIDMAHVFGEYQKFKDLRQVLQGEIDQTEAKIKNDLTQLKKIQDELKAFKQGSPEYTAREKSITELAAQIEADRKNAQREFFRKESKIYQTIYAEVTRLVEQYAEAKNYTLVIRFSRTNLSNDDPQRVMQALQQQVVYHRADDDITETVLRYMNSSYAKSAGAPAARTTPRKTSGKRAAAPR